MPKSSRASWRLALVYILFVPGFAIEAVRFIIAPRSSFVGQFGYALGVIVLALFAFVGIAILVVLRRYELARSDVEVVVLPGGIVCRRFGLVTALIEWENVTDFVPLPQEGSVMVYDADGVETSVLVGAFANPASVDRFMEDAKRSMLAWASGEDPLGRGDA